MPRLAIVEDNTRYRKTLVGLFSDIPEYDVANAFANGKRIADHVQTLDTLPWDVVLMDVAMPELDGIETTRRLKKRFPDLPIIMLTFLEEPTTIMEAICAGASGYLVKRSSLEELQEQVELVLAGGAALTPEVARTLIDLVRVVENPAKRRVPAADVGLTGRERQVLACLVDGQAYKHVAATLEISIETVRTYVKRIYQKLQVHSVSEAVVRAIRDGLV